MFVDECRAHGREIRLNDRIHGLYHIIMANLILSTTPTSCLNNIIIKATIEFHAESLPHKNVMPETVKLLAG